MTSSPDNPETVKRRIAEVLIPHIPIGARIGMGTGTTVNALIERLGQSEHYKSLECGPVVPSSRDTARRLQAAGIPVMSLNEAGNLDLYIDGADEANAAGYLIKGGGGALTQEKIVAAASRRFWCIIDYRKYVGVLGTFPVPVEVIPMAQSYVARQLCALGGRPVYRTGFETDNGHIILDVHGLDLTDPIQREKQLSQIPGVVESGIFAQQRPHLIWIGQKDGSVLRHTPGDATNHVSH